jgi:hypothetical protein
LRNRAQKIKEWITKGKDHGKHSYHTLIDNKDEDIIGWAHNRLTQLIEDRNIVMPTKLTGDDVYSHRNFIELMKRNYAYYYDLKSRMLRDSTCSDESPVINWMLQRIRTKYGIMTANIKGFQFDKFSEDDTDFVYKVNQVVRVKLLQQEYIEAMLDSLLKLSVFGTSHIGLLHTFAWNEPDGEQYFEALDPLGVLVNFGALRLNGRTSHRAKTVILIRMRPKGMIEREYGVDIESDDPSDFIDVTKISLIHAVTGNKFQYKSDMLPEIMIFHDDETREPIMERNIKRRPVKVMDTNEDLLDENGELVYEDVYKDGEPVYEEKATDGMRMKYPNGRLIVLCGHQVLYDDVNPCDHGMRPLVKLSNTEDGINYWGLSDIDIGASTQQAITRLDSDIFESISQCIGALGIDETKLRDKNENVFREQGVKIIRMKAECNINNSAGYLQATGLTQDAYLYRYKLVDDLGYLIGTPGVTMSKSFAAESGSKFESQYNVAVEFHNPIEVNQVLVILQLARMWFFNERQFNRGVTNYSVEDRQGIREGLPYSGAMENMKKDYPVEVSIYKMAPTGREQDMSELISLKEIVPELPNDLVLRLSRIPEVVQYARQEKANRIGLAGILQGMDKAGFGPILEKIAARNEAAGGGNGGVSVQ